ncbi:hypothetical protein CLAIMM_07034 [Cladophialophora immunda]|nr:hypothetical protein CLAIMM_07034 [Cladophialophora immunda]
MSRNRFRVRLEPRDEAGASANTSSDDAGAPPPTLESQVRVFSTKGKDDWILRKRKVRAPHPRRKTTATPPAIKQEKSPEDGLSNLTSSDPKDDKEEDSTTQRRRKNRRSRSSASLTDESTKTIPPRVTAQSQTSSSSSSAADSILDDLRSHPHSLTVEEQNFVIKWLQFQATAAWGSNSTGRFCPCRDIAWRGIQMYPAGGLPWTLIFCDMFLSWSRRQPLPQRLHQRKALAYKYIAKLLADPQTQASDEALLCVCLAMSADARSLSPEINRVHLKGLAQMIAKRGVGSLFSTVCFMFHPMFSLAYFAMAELEATSMLDVRGAAEKFLGTLRSMQQDGHRSQSDAMHRRRSDDVSEGGVPNQDIDSRSGSSVSSSLWSVAMGKSAINHAVEGVLANPRSKTPSIQQDLSLFLNLYLLNLILWDFLEWPDSAAVFLQQLSIHADNARVRLEMTVWLLAKSWVDADEISQRTDGGAKKEVFLTEAVIDALKIFSRIPDESKEKLILVLSSWLFGCGDEEDGGGGGPEGIDAAVTKPEEGPSSFKARNAPGRLGAGSDGTPERSVSAQRSAADQKRPGKDIDPKLVTPPHQAQVQVQSAGITSKAFRYLSDQDFGGIMAEACSDWYEKNVSKRPLPPMPMISIPPTSPPQRQQQRQRAHPREGRSA